MDGLLSFYRGRIESAPYYGFKSGHEIILCVLRTAFYDSKLTQNEFITIMNLCEIAHRIMMEDNYNDGWSE